MCNNVTFGTPKIYDTPHFAENPLGKQHPIYAVYTPWYRISDWTWAQLYIFQCILHKGVCLSCTNIFRNQQQQQLSCTITRTARGTLTFLQHSCFFPQRTILFFPCVCVCGVVGYHHRRVDYRSSRVTLLWLPSIIEGVWGIHFLLRLSPCVHSTSLTYLFWRERES